MGGMFGGGGGGGGQTISQTHAEYPEQFRPLAEAAVKQIMASQNRIPLESFASALPARVAGLSPFTEAGMSLVPSLMSSTPTQQGLQQMPQTIGDVMAQFGGVMQPTNAAQGALGFLGGQIGRNLQLAPSQWQPPHLPQVASSPTVFPGFNAPVAPPPNPQLAPPGGVVEVPPLMPTAPPTATGPAAGAGPAAPTGPFIQLSEPWVLQSNGTYEHRLTGEVISAFGPPPAPAPPPPALVPSNEGP